MIDHKLLGNLSQLHQMMGHLVENCRGDRLNSRPMSEIHSLGWLFGRAVYLETYWLREMLDGDDDLTKRVRHIFGPEQQGATTDSLIPPKMHLLNWALEIQDEHLSRLANPGRLHEHPLLKDGWLAAYIIQVEGLIYEQMLSTMTAWAIQDDTGTFEVKEKLSGKLPNIADAVPVSQGHYRTGAKEGVVFDNEVPPQIVELSNYRIFNTPVSNAEYLSFVEAGGYRTRDVWTDEGNKWLEENKTELPWHWKRNESGDIFAVGINGAYELLPDDPVQGLSLHEASAYVSWLSKQHEDYSGVVIQHEYQWEVAARIKAIQNIGRIWEWCSNLIAPYDAYKAPGDEEMRTQWFDQQHYAQRGGSLHTQPSLRRASLRKGVKMENRFEFSGLRLVLPPA